MYDLYEGSVILVPVQDIFERVIALPCIAYDAALELDDILGINKYLEIKQVTDLIKIKHKQSFDQDHRGGLEGKDHRLSLWIVEYILLLPDFLALDEHPDVPGKSLIIDRLRQVKILVTCIVPHLHFSRTVVFVL